MQVYLMWCSIKYRINMLLIMKRSKLQKLYSCFIFNGMDRNNFNKKNSHVYIESNKVFLQSISCLSCGTLNNIASFDFYRLPLSPSPPFFYLRYRYCNYNLISHLMLIRACRSEFALFCNWNS